ncbi:MAG: hypothetical protein ACM3ZC_00600 [Bacteroidota bacterium]
MIFPMQPRNSFLGDRGDELVRRPANVGLDLMDHPHERWKGFLADSRYLAGRSRAESDDHPVVGISPP